MTGHLFAGMGAHHSPRAKTVDWWTPPYVIAALGGPDAFSLDPCASARQLQASHAPFFRTARRAFTEAEDGLAQSWEGRMWCNPPYSSEEAKRWLSRMAKHNEGTALIFARTETDTFFRHGWDAATAMLFIRKRLNFYYPHGLDPARCFGGADHEWIVMDDGAAAQGCKWCGVAKKNSGAPSVLIAYGQTDAEILAACPIEGKFIPLLIPKAILTAAIEPSWRELIAQLMAASDGPVRLDDIYRAVIDHPKARGNRNPEAKVRQQLQRGPYRRVNRGLWERADEI